MAERLICPACGSADIAGLFHAKDHLVSSREFLIMRCNACGMGWTADPPPEEEAGNFYVSEEYISHTDRKQSISDYIYVINQGTPLADGTPDVGVLSAARQLGVDVAEQLLADGADLLDRA